MTNLFNNIPVKFIRNVTAINQILIRFGILELPPSIVTSENCHVYISAMLSQKIAMVILRVTTAHHGRKSMLSLLMCIFAKHTKCNEIKRSIHLLSKALISTKQYLFDFGNRDSINVEIYISKYFVQSKGICTPKYQKRALLLYV